MRSDVNADLTTCVRCPAGSYQDTMGQASCLPCIPGKYQSEAGHASCLVCSTHEFTSAVNQIKCQECDAGTYTNGPGSTSCQNCGAGQYSLSNVCTKCPVGWKRGDIDTSLAACHKCQIGEMTAVAGSASCEKCPVGKFGAKHGVCSDCPAGRYQDGKGEKHCKECGFDTYLSETGKSSNADCLQCSANFAPHTKTLAKGITNAATGCLCAGANPDDTKYPKGFYTVGEEERELQLLEADPSRRLLCRECPEGADCARDGMLLGMLSALPGHWRPSIYVAVFSSCSQGYRGVEKHKLAKARCCPTRRDVENKETATANKTVPLAGAFSICRSKDIKSNGTDSQCLAGFAGPLCLSCDQGYVKRSGSCVECPAGASFAAGMAPICTANVLLFLFVLLVLRKGDGTQEKHSARKAKKWFGQAKILLSFIQIFCAMPNVLTGIPWPNVYLDFSIPLQLFNLDFLSVLAEASCSVSVRFFDQLLIHLMLPVISMLVLTAAYKAAARCVEKNNEAKHEQMKKTVSKFYILTILLMFPGLSTKIFTTFKCKAVEGITGYLLMEDWSVSCGVGEHVIYALIAAGAVFVCEW